MFHCSVLVAVTPSTKYKELSPQTRRAVARGLSQDGSWLKLAHNLGMSTNLKSSNIKLKSSPFTAAVLCGWRAT